MAQREGGIKEFLWFEVGELGFGMPIEGVKEVAEIPSLFPAPLLPPHVKGLALLEMEVVACLDMGAFFDLSSKVARALLLEWQNFRTFLLVEKIQGIVEIPLEKVCDLPRNFTLPKGLSECIQGIYLQKGRKILILKIPELLEKMRPRF